MKTKTQLILGTTIGLLVGFAAGFYSSQVRHSDGQARVAALQQAADVSELQRARDALNRLKQDGLEPNHPAVIKLQLRVSDLEAKQNAQ
jgi:hypothetical protein